VKRNLFFIFLLIFTNSSNVLSVQDDRSKKALYDYYFMLKETCNFFIASALFFDDQKIENAGVQCNQCDLNLTAGYLWAHCACHVNELILSRLIHAVYYESQEELAQFILYSHEQLQIECPHCQQYHGWYIADSLSA